MPNWFDKLQAVIQSEQDPEEHADAQSENTREEWMIISDLHSPFNNSSEANAETFYQWHNDRSNYSDQQIGEMPAWIKNIKDHYNPDLHKSYEEIYISSFSEMQGLAYNIVRDHFENSTPVKNSLAHIIIGVAKTGKSYLINAIRGLLQDKCVVTATTSKAAFNVNGVTVHSLLYTSWVKRK